MNVLNPKLFSRQPDDTYKLHSGIRDKLLEIASTFKSYLEEDGLSLNVVDVRLVGSNAGYDYNDASDIDLHLVADLDCMACDSSIVQVALNAEKTKFNTTLDISIKGIPVELYVEDVRTGVNSNGIYSLTRDCWIKYPIPEKQLPEDVLAVVAAKTSEWVTLISKALVRRNENELQRIINRLYLMRKDGLDTKGPKSLGNLIFKEIRKQGYLDKVKLARDEAISERLTMECRIAREALNQHGN